ncbi:hypothetical protein [Pseudobacteroides cellulosolvens]|uniref:hypothetical protein n=1 Tax=Pseudobacteroides cellulosolvens TaxID=35825 RepID=UPI001395CF11|nr:hypothetical protein [Pseudobacteroides cellulosolvens]
MINIGKIATNSPALSRISENASVNPIISKRSFVLNLNEFMLSSAVKKAQQTLAASSTCP